MSRSTRKRRNPKQVKTARRRTALPRYVSGRELRDLRRAAREAEEQSRGSE